MNKLELLSHIHHAMSICTSLNTDEDIVSISFENDNYSGEIIVDALDENGHTTSFIISTSSIREE